MALLKTIAKLRKDYLKKFNKVPDVLFFHPKAWSMLRFELDSTEHTRANGEKYYVITKTMPNFMYGMRIVITDIIGEKILMGPAYLWPDERVKCVEYLKA